MVSPTIKRLVNPSQESSEPEFTLTSGAKIAVIGGGPAGSFFAYYALDMAERIGLDIKVDVFEPRNYEKPGPTGCNMCGGIISESLVQNLAMDGINLPPTVIQRGIDSYQLHTDTGSVLIDTPLQEKRIGAVHRGPGPRDVTEAKWQSFDGFLQKQSIEKGANIIAERVSDIQFEDGRPKLTFKKEESQTYDALAVAVGVNSPIVKKFMEFGFTPAETTKTYICEYFLGSDVIEQYLGSSMHVFLLNIPRLEFAALIPKGDYVTCAMLGEDIDKELVTAFLSSPEVTSVMPPNWQVGQRSCQCSPRINIRGAEPPFMDRVVFIGDSGVTRLYKDGIGAAYRTAKAAASTVIFQGVSKKDFQEHFWKACQTINQDNAIGRISFAVTEQIQKRGFARRALVHMTAKEQTKSAQLRRMSTVMWDMFTGSAPYKEIFMRTLHPNFLITFGWEMLQALWPFSRSSMEKSTSGERL
jgi:flavin-dependent dehydrogenase